MLLRLAQSVCSIIRDETMLMWPNVTPGQNECDPTLIVITLEQLPSSSSNPRPQYMCLPVSPMCHHVAKQQLDHFWFRLISRETWRQVSALSHLKASDYIVKILKLDNNLDFKFDCWHADACYLVFGVLWDEMHIVYCLDLFLFWLTLQSFNPHDIRDNVRNCRFVKLWTLILCVSCVKCVM